MSRSGVYRGSGVYDRSGHERTSSVSSINNMHPRTERTSQINQIMADLDKEELAKRRFVNMTFENRESLITSISAWRRNICAILALQGEYSIMSRDEYSQAVINCLKQSDIIPITRSENLLAKFLLELLLNESYSQDTILGAARILELNRRIEDLESKCALLEKENSQFNDELAQITKIDIDLLPILVRSKYQSRNKYLEERILETKIQMTTNKYQNKTTRTLREFGRKPSLLTKFSSQKIVNDNINNLKDFNDLNKLYNNLVAENQQLKERLNEYNQISNENDFNKILQDKNIEIKQLEDENNLLQNQLQSYQMEMQQLSKPKLTSSPPQNKSRSIGKGGELNDELLTIYNIFDIDPYNDERIDQLQLFKSNSFELQKLFEQSQFELKNIYSMYNIDFNDKKRFELLRNKLYNNNNPNDQEYIDKILELYNIPPDSQNKFNVVYNNIIDINNRNKELNKIIENHNKELEKLYNLCDIEYTKTTKLDDKTKLITDFCQEREDAIQNLVEIVFTENDDEGTLDDIVEKVRELANNNNKLTNENKSLKTLLSGNKNKKSNDATMEYIDILNKYNEILDTIDCNNMSHHEVLKTLEQLKQDSQGNNNNNNSFNNDQNMIDPSQLKSVYRLVNIKPTSNNKNNIDLLHMKIEELLSKHNESKTSLDDIKRIDDNLNKIYEAIDTKPFENRADGLDYIYVYIKNLEEEEEYGDDYNTDDESEPRRNKLKENINNNDRTMNNKNIMGNKILYELREFKSNLTDLKSVTVEEEEEPTTEEEYIKIIKTIIYKMERNTKFLIDNYENIPLNVEPNNDDTQDISLLKTANHELELQVNQLIEDKILKDDQISVILSYLNLPESSSPNQILQKITNLQNSIIDGPTILKINSDLENKYKNLLIQFIYLKKLYNTIKQTCYYSVDKNIIDTIESKVPFNKDSILNAYFTTINPQCVNWKRSSTDPNCIYNQHKDGWTTYHLLQFFQSLKLKFTSKQINHIFVELDENNSGLLEYNEFVHINKYIEFKKDLLSKFRELDKDNRLYLNVNVIKDLLYELGLGRLYELSIKQTVILNNLINYETFTKLCLQISLLIDFTPAN